MFTCQACLQTRVENGWIYYFVTRKPRSQEAPLALGPRPLAKALAPDHGPSTFSIFIFTFIYSPSPAQVKNQLALGTIEF
jgi:hypothetical protein